jgi:hypothetical protein
MNRRQMMGVSFLRVRNVRHFVLVGLVALCGQVAGLPLLAADVVPICESVCGEETDCNELCYVDMMEFGNGNDITCGEFDGGYGGYQCSSETFDTCNWECSPTGASGTLCTEEGSQSTCGSYGVYLQCGDGVCTESESCESCAADCGGSCPSVGSSEAADIAALVEIIDGLGGFDGSFEGASIASQEFADEGYLDPGDVVYGVEEIDGEEQYLCIDKFIQLMKVDAMIRSLRRQRYWLAGCAVYYGPMCGPPLLVVIAALDGAQDLRDIIENKPCTIPR